MYHITVRGPDVGGTDGIDLICDDNCYLHDFEVTNRDECVSVKTPSQNVLIEDAYCNHSGGMSIGSLTADDVTEDTMAALSNITMNNIYSYKSTQMLMIKTFPGGDGSTGYVKDSKFINFWGYDCTYGLDIDQYWENHDTPNTGAVALSGLTFSNWTGHVDNGVSRGPIVIRGSDQVPLTDITLEDFDMWTLNGDKIINQCKNAFGTGYCLQELASAAQASTYTVSSTVTATPTAYVSPAKPSWAVEGYGTTDPIPIYTPAAMWPVSASSVQVHAQVTTPAASEYTLASPPASATTAPAATAFSVSSEAPILTSYPSVSIFSTISLSNGLPVESSSSAVVQSASAPAASSQKVTSSKTPCSSELASAMPVTTPVASESTLIFSTPVTSGPVSSPSKTPCSNVLASVTPSTIPAASESTLASSTPIASSPSAYTVIPVEPSVSAPTPSSAPAPTAIGTGATVVYTSYPSVSIFPTLALSNGLPVESPESTPVASAGSKKPCSSSVIVPAPVTTPVASEASRAVETPAVSASVGEVRTVVVTVTKTSCPKTEATISE